MTTRLLPALLLALPLLPGAAGAQTRPPERSAVAAQASPAARPFGTPSGPSRIQKTLTEPLGLAPPGGRQAQVETAPIPNRSIEAPRDRFATSSAASLEPMLLPPDRRQGQTFGREHLRETGPDRPFDLIVPGARLVIPFDGNSR